MPPVSAFRVVTTPGYAEVQVTDVEASGRDVMLTLASRLAPGTTVGITYDVPDSGAIRDADGLEAVGTTWQTAMASPVDPVWLSTATVEARGEYRGYWSIASPDLGAVADRAFDFGEGAAYEVQVVLAYSDGVIFQVRGRSDAIAGLVLEWMGETLPLADAVWDANWDRYTWGQAWLTLASATAPGDTVTVAYLGSAMHPLATADGQVRSGPWEGLVAKNVTGMAPPGAPVAMVDLRHADPLAVAPNGALRLDASGLGLTEVWGLARFTALERLDLSENALTDLSPLAGLVNLRDLDLSRNRVADLWPLAGLLGLERLDLSGNRVTDVQALAGLANLEVLLLDGNAVADAWPLAALGRLENLSLGGNRIGDMTALQDLAYLRRLDLTGNPAADLSPLGDVGSLVWLALPGRRVSASEQTLGRLTRLGWVWLGGADAPEHDGAAARR